MSCESDKFVRRLVIICTVSSWVVIASNSGFVAVMMFFNDTLGFVILAPVGVHVTVPDSMPHKVLVYSTAIYLVASWCFPMTMTVLLATIFSHQFIEVMKRLRDALRNSRHVEESVIEEIRQQHQDLCLLVEKQINS